MNEGGVDLVRRYNDAWLQRDVPSMAGFLGDDLILWHNHIQREFGKEEMLGFISSALDVLTRVEFRNVRRMGTANGVVQQHDLYVEMKDGGVLPCVPNCIVYTVGGGKIRRIEEYVDGAALSAVAIAA